jgi:predicted NUDIX family phosphoesterase
MKQALCVASFEELNTLVTNKDSQVEAKMFTLEDGALPEGGLQQIVPYVSFFAVDVEEGKLMVIQYQHNSEGEGEERVSGKTSIGFSGSIKEEDIVTGMTTQEDDGTKSYAMSLQNLVETGVKAAGREIKEQLGVDLDGMNVAASKAESAFFTGDMSDEYSQSSIGLSIQVQVTPEKFLELKNAFVIKPEQIEQLDVLGVNLPAIVEEMDVTRTLNLIIDDLREKHGLEDWSCRIFNYITRKVIDSILRSVTYKDLIAIVQTKAAMAQEATAETTEAATA